MSTISKLKIENVEYDLKDIKAREDIETLKTRDIEITNKVENVDSIIKSSLANISDGTPLIASSIEGMTDTSRIYVNTSDGHWYYHNGTSWVDGGVYQSTGIEDGSITINKLSDYVKDNLVNKVNTEDLKWTRVTIYNGNESSSTDCISSDYVWLEKGSVIKFHNEYKSRITRFDVNYDYISSTGTYVLRDTYVAEGDGYYRIGINKSEVEVLETEGNLTNVEIYGYEFPKENIFIENIPFENGVLSNGDPYGIDTGSPMAQKRIFSKPFLVGKGSIIRIKHPYKLIVDKYDLNYTYISSTDWMTKTTYEIEEDCIIRLRIAKNGDPIITESEFEFYKTRVTFDKYLEPYNNIEVNDYMIYVTANGVVNYIPDGGSILLNISTALNVKTRNTTLFEKSFEDLCNDFSENVVEKDGVKYIKINSYSSFVFNIVTQSFELVSNKFPKYNKITLINNAYDNIVGGELVQYINYTQLKNTKSAHTVFNSSYVDEKYNWKTKVKEFTSSLNGLSNEIETYLFFTDQHLMGSENTFDETKLQNAITKIQKVYNSIPANFIVSGGDWLNNKDNQAEATFKLGYIDGFMNNMFKNYYPVLGNHDTNYQGKLTDESEDNTGTLSDETQINLWFRRFGEKYYSFKGLKSTNYVLDSGTDWTPEMDEYKWNQVEWLAEQLRTDNPEHATLFMHIIWNNGVQPLADNITKLVNAFNNHTTITLNDKTYDFTSNTGHVDYAISGHNHMDYDEVVNNIQCISTINLMQNGEPTYDLVINDYENNKVKLIRVGTGTNREFNL